MRVSVNGADFEDVFTYTSPGPDLWTNVVVDLDDLPGAAGNDAFAFEVVSVWGANTNRYVAAGPSSTYAPSGTWRFDDVAVTGDPDTEAPEEPRILVAPLGRSVTAGTGFQLGVGASGAPPLRYQWSRNDEELPGETGPVLIRESAGPDAAGHYHVSISNEFGVATSDPVEVVVVPPPPPYQLTDCGALHRAVVGPEFGRPAVEGLVGLEGIVTTDVSLTSAGNLLFYLQDKAGGVAIFWKAASPELLPAAGTRIRVIGRVAQANGVLQVVADASDPIQGVTVLEENRPLPDPVDLDVGALGDPVRMESLEGQRVRISGVTLDTRTPVFPNRGANLALSLPGTSAKVILRVDGDSRGARVDLAGQAKPVGPFTVTGIWSQNDSTRPFTEGYQILPTRWVDLVPDGRPPEVEWTVVIEHPRRVGDALTNSFQEQVLLPGEGIRITAQFSDDQGPILPGTGNDIPEGAELQWGEESASNDGIHHRNASLRFTASAADAGRLHRVALTADGIAATRRLFWTVYVPAAAEQQVQISEYLANPTSRSSAPSFNPLNRDDWPPAQDAALASKLTSWDEFVEIVNLGDTPVNLGNWTLSDATRVRAWLDPEEPACIVPSQSALVIFGGPVGTHEPRLGGATIAALPGPESVPGSDGLGLNNTGDTLMLRNAEGHLVERVVYGARNVSEDGSMVRWPLPDGPWKPHTQVDPTRGASPGSPPTGTEWIPGNPSPQLKLGCVLESDHIRLFWAAEPGSSYTIRELTLGSPGGKVLAEGFQGGEFLISLGTAGDRWFQVTSP
ncbi:MAG: lamin tail domain-containing protein [Verrucomicrobiota bacterium]